MTKSLKTKKQELEELKQKVARLEEEVQEIDIKKLPGFNEVKKAATAFAKIHNNIEHDGVEVNNCTVFIDVETEWADDNVTYMSYGLGDSIPDVETLVRRHPDIDKAKKALAAYKAAMKTFLKNNSIKGYFSKRDMIEFLFEIA